MSLKPSSAPTASRLPARPARGAGALDLALALACTVALLAGCASPGHRAPVEDRKPASRPVASPPGAASAPMLAAPMAPAVADATPAKPLPPGAENAGKPGYYTVRPGDTLIRIGLDNGQPWRDIARWSALENVNLIEVGQVLRVAPPVADSAGTSTRPVATAGPVDSRPLDGRPAAAPASAATPASGQLAATRVGDADLGWAWPAAGPVVTGFVEGKSPGLDIVGKLGDAVLAAADGRVIFTGAHRGYGNLIIIKHDATFLSAYAHNQSLLVKEEDAVRKGQKIAEMGSSDAERVQLHFEVRRLGKPIDPARLLPPR